MGTTSRWLEKHLKWLLVKFWEIAKCLELLVTAATLKNLKQNS